jgi:hypothetical protein
MSSMVILRDLISVFHGTNGKHAGTLTITERIYSDGTSGEYEWSWIGGPFGPLNGFCGWYTEGPTLWLEVRNFPWETMRLQNSSWAGVKRPPQRPWFKSSDKIVLTDPNFIAKFKPEPKEWHHFKCKLLAAA